MPGAPGPGSPLGRIGHYRIVRRLGAGGMGVVYLGQDEAAGIAAAVKVIRPEYATDPRFRARLRREVAAARRVPRFCTAQVLAGDLDADPPWVATEYIDGPTLDAAVLERGRLRGSELAAFAAGVAVALREIHRHGVIHRDLKPSNILLSAVGPRVIDFGIARVDDSWTQLTHHGGMVGTPAYMAPEQLRGEPVTAAVDVFAWATVVTYAATGRLPFGAGEAAMPAIWSGEPDLGDLSGSLRELVSAAFRKDPAARPAAAELVERLARAAVAETREVLATATTPALPPVLVAGAAPVPYPGSGPGEPPAAVPAWAGAPAPAAATARSWQWLAAAAVAFALVIAVMATAAIWYASRGSPDAAAPGGTGGSGADECLLGTWTMTSARKTWNLAGSQVQLSSQSPSVRYFRSDGTALLDFRDGQRETGATGGVSYQVVITGTIGFRYRASGDELLNSDVQADGELVVSINGLVISEEPLVAITEPLPYACAGDELTIYEPTGSSQYVRTGGEQ